MSETGWPLIPREVLPAPVPKKPGLSAPSEGSGADDNAAGKGRRPPLAPRPIGRQLPFFGAETTEPSPADLAGLLAGPGRLGRMGGTARVSVEVDAAWRVHVLVAELVVRGLTAHWRPLTEDQDQDHDADVRVDEHPTSSGAPQPAENHHAPDADPFDDVYPDPDAWPDSSAADEPVTDDLLEDGRGDPQHSGAGRPLPSPGELSHTVGRRPPAREEESEISDPLGRPTPPTGPGPQEAPSREAPSREAQSRVVSFRQALSGDGEAPSREAEDKEADTEESEEDRAERSASEPRPRFEVLTAYSSRLNGLARGWPDAAAQLFLSGPRLRLWVAAAGEPVPGGYALGLDPGKDQAAVDAALVRAGLAGRVSDDGRHYVIAGKRRLRRLAELVGERPDAAPEHAWPGGAGA